MKTFSHCLLLLLSMLCAGCSSDDTGTSADSASSAAAPNLLRLAAICHERDGEWIKDKGCGLTEKLCFSMFHGHATWFRGPGCMVDKANQTDKCSHEGMQGGTQHACYIQYIPVVDWQHTK